MENLIKEWLSAKAIERDAIEKRRSIEDEISSLINLSNDFEGVYNLEFNEYTIKLTSRLNKKVDSDLIQEIAAEYNIEYLLPQLFRWKPEINMAVWKKTNKEVLDKFQPAIITTPSRPSFNITTKEK